MRSFGLKAMLRVSILILGLTGVALAQSQGDPNKYSTTPGNPSCRFFDGFADNGDGTFTDPRNGLMWKRCAEGFSWEGSGCMQITVNGVRQTDFSWTGGIEAALNSRFLGANDWRLPRKDELMLLVGPYRDGNGGGCEKNRSTDFAAGSLIMGHFQRANGVGGQQFIIPAFTQRTEFFSSTSVDDLNAWTVRLDGYAGSGSKGEENQNVWLVRSSAASSLEDIKNFKKEAKGVAIAKKWVADRSRIRKAERLEWEEENNQAKLARANPRGGLREMIYLDAVKAYAAYCNSGYSDTFERTNLGQFCGGAASGKFSCFQSPSGAANHICN